MTTAEVGKPIQQRPLRPPRPNHGRIQAKQLPVDVFPLPPLIPHNPFSLIHIAYAYLSQLVSPPSSHSARARGWSHPETNSVHITDAAQIRLLWERGFFGKGSLSRSEPTWLDRERKRLGLLGQHTSEEFTQRRREERRKMKTERARKEREAIEETLQREANHASVVSLNQAPEAPGVVGTLSEREKVERVTGAPQIRGGSPSLHDNSGQIAKGQPTADFVERQEMGLEDKESAGPVSEPHQQEHLQLCPEEAFFLAYALGILDVFDPATQLPISVTDLLPLFRSHSYFPPLSPLELKPYDPFLLSYVAYHHFRSLGWVVRPGMKFAVDWLLYLRGPAFAHAEFAVVILPAFRDAYWWEGTRRPETQKRTQKDWWWLHCLQRVQAQVRKGLVICWVEIPRPDQVETLVLSAAEREVTEAKGLGLGEKGSIESLLKKYKVRDMIVKRWIPNRNRD